MDNFKLIKIDNKVPTIAILLNLHKTSNCNNSKDIKSLKFSDIININNKEYYMIGWLIPTLNDIHVTSRITGEQEINIKPNESLNLKYLKTNLRNTKHNNNSKIYNYIEKYISSVLKSIPEIQDLNIKQYGNEIYKYIDEYILFIKPILEQI